MDERNPFTKDQLGYPSDDALFMLRFEKNLQFERRRFDFATPSWHSDLSHAVTVAFLVAAFVAVLYPILPGATHFLSGVGSPRNIINIGAIMLAAAFALPKVYAELFRG